MSRAAAAGSRRYTPRRLYEQARPLHRPRIQWMNAGWVCVFAAAGLSLIGVLAIGTTEPGLAVRHLIHLCLGLCAATMIATPHYEHLRRWSTPILILIIGLLIFVLIPFVPESIVRPRSGGARRWISLVVIDFQPSELAKIAYIMSLASYLRFRDNYRTLRGLLLPAILTFIPMGLVLVEPDLGTALLFLPTLFAMLIAAGAKLWHMVLIVMIGLSAAPAMYPLLKPYQKARVQAMIAQIRGDDRYDETIGYQADRAMTLVGAGQWTGVGKEHAAALVRYNSLPEEHNDMIFAVVTCRWGMLGGLTVGGLTLLLAAGALLTAALCREPFGRLVAVGLGAIMFTQATINIGMTIGLLPITGMTLPFVSAGGSSLIAAWLMIGLLFNIALRRNRFLLRESFEYDPPVED